MALPLRLSLSLALVHCSSLISSLQAVATRRQLIAFPRVTLGPTVVTVAPSRWRSADHVPAACRQWYCAGSRSHSHM